MTMITVHGLGSSIGQTMSCGLDSFILGKKKKGGGQTLQFDL